MASIAQIARPSIRHFSAHRPRPDSRAARAVATGCIVTGVVLPFVPPALESSRQRSSGMSTSANWCGETNPGIQEPPTLLPRALVAALLTTRNFDGELTVQALTQHPACDMMHYAQGVWNSAFLVLF
ncbi:unnamed protein product [Penicillium glandicola]